MATRGKKAGKRATAPKRAKPVRKPKPAQTGSARPKRKSGDPASEIARLKSQLRTAQDHQNAASDVLKVIASSPSDVQPVFEAIAESAKRLLGSHTAVVTRVIDGVVHFAAGTAEHEAGIHAAKGLLPYPLSSPRIHARVARTGKLALNTDSEIADLPQSVKEFAQAMGWRSMLVVPMLRKGTAIGTVGITRREPGLFDDKTIDLLKTFADQAVIAIENVRLFNETREALERQTATADILRVISSSRDDVQPVFNAVAEHAARICGAGFVDIIVVQGEVMRQKASFGNLLGLNTGETVPLDRTTVMGRSIVDGTTVHVADALALEGDFPGGKALAIRFGHRTVLAVPLLHEGRALGTILARRTEVRPFEDKHIALLKTFADQAAIAIENARLLNETQEALERQTATADILKVIASSPSDVQPVFDAIAERSNRIVEGFSTTVLSIVDETIYLSAFTRTTAAGDAALKAFFPRPLSTVSWSEAIGRGEIFQIADSEVDLPAHASAREMARLRGWRSSLYVPLLRDNKPIGAIGVTRVETGAFSDHHVQLLRTFADQAVIAIENVRLFNETQEALERQTATADILKVIASSPENVQPVFEAIADRSNRIVDGRSTAVYSLVDDVVHLMAFTPTSPEADAALRARFPLPLSEVIWGKAIREGSVFGIDDIEDGSFTQQAVRDLARLRGYRSLLFVPLLRDQKPIGAISVTRVAPGPLADNHVQLLQTFADQAAIAISNVELFRKLQDRTRELSQSLDDLRAAQDRLVQTEKLASLGQLTAGIAHEIKNPLNFVNNFSALSAELTDELNDTLGAAALTDKMRKEVSELTRLLKDNLEKIVQHGKRADSIVKNMLLHSREGSGEQRLADVNALVDESLNLAYHGARAEKSGFTITLQRDFDANAGTLVLFPQEITRALLNLISNGFYAATKRKTENGEQDFEPMLLATTKNLGGSVEIRIRDNGTGIPADVREKMFNPFFTTKPAGEGTGLGLSMTHDIVVKQHGGRIDVATEPGQFTEFTIVLPRSSRSPNEAGGRT